MRYLFRAALVIGTAVILGLGTLSAPPAIAASAANSTDSQPLGPGSTATATPKGSTATATPTIPPSIPPLESASPEAPTSPTAEPKAVDPVAAQPDPSLGEMNAARNHSMGSTIRDFDPEFAVHAKQKSTRLYAMAASSLIPPGVPGMDVSGWQVLTAADWRQIAANGGKFVYVKATESTDYTSSQFSEQYNDSYAAGLIRGAYHFATPDTSSGAAQANFLVDHGGGWSNDGHTLPPLLDIEYNPYGQTCYGLSPSQMVAWIADFSNTVKARTGTLPAIYSTTNWWNACTGSSSAFSANPLFIASWPSNVANGPGTLPPGWSNYTIWQFTNATYSNGQPGLFPGDQDVFNGTLSDLQAFARNGSTTAGSSLVRTVGDSTVFLLSGSDKYPIGSLELMNAFSVLGPVGFVSDQFLAGYVTRQAATRVLRSPDGTIFFTDAGIKLPFGSCGLVVDYGGQCVASGYVQLTDEQLSHFATGPAMGPVLGTTAGARYYVTAGTKREILDNQSQAAAGIPGGFNVLTEAAVSGLPFGPPVVRDGVFAVQRGTSSYSYLGNNARYPVEAGAVVSSDVAGRVAGSLYAQSLALIPAGASSFTGIVQASGSSVKSVLAGGGRYDWAGASTTALPAVSVPQAFIDSYPSKGSIAAGSMIKTASSATVYIVMDSKILPVGAWESLVALAGGKTPTIVTVPDQLVNVLPKGAVALTSNTLVRSPDEATVYLVNGVTNKIAMSNFAYANEAGITGYSYTTQARLDAYPRAKDLLGMGLTCGTTNYVSAGGSVHPVSAALLPQYPFTYVPLDKFTCALLKVGAPATPFIRTPDGTIYYLNAGQKHPIGSMTTYQKLSNGQSWLDVVPLFANPIPTGPAV